MFLRRDRSHQGKTNCDFRSTEKQVQRSDWNTSIDFLANPRSTKFDQIVKNRLLRSVPNPVQTQKEFYVEQSRTIPQKPKIQRTRFAQLEEKELRKPVWVGDSEVLLNDRIMEDKSQLDPEYKQRQINREHLAKQKHNYHGKASMETQLIGMEEFSHQTLEGKIDIHKVQEIRRAIRRRYASRKNFQKIFSQWDEEAKGCISPQNVYNMIKKLGLNLNENEARVLVASADRNQSGSLTLDEFMELIFNDNDAMNVNLASLKQIDGNTQNEQEEVVGLLHEDVKQQMLERHENQVNLVLKHKLSKLNQQLQEADVGLSGLLNLSKFKDSIRKLQISEKIISDDDLKQIFTKYRKDDHYFEYPQFLQSLRDFEFNTDSIYQQPQTQAKKKNNPKLVVNLLAPTLEEQKLKVYDCTKMTSYTLDKTRTRANQVIQTMQRYLPTQAEFDRLIVSKLPNKSTISADELANRITGFLNSVGETPDKQHIESFLSIIQYNDNEVPPLEVGRVVYEEDDTAFFLRAGLRQQGPRPTKVKSLASTIQYQTTEVIEEVEVEEKFYNKTLGLGSSTANLPPKLVGILQRLEDHTFRASARQLDVFKSFDVDHDGYVSQKDFLERVGGMHILSKPEMTYLLKYFDPANEGSVNFREFSARIFPGMTKCAPTGDQVVVSSLLPAKERTENMKQHLPDLKRIRTEDNFIKAQVGAKRFSATPIHKNTFWNIQQPPTDSAMFMNEANRFVQSYCPRIEYQKEEYEKNDKVRKAILNRIRNNNEAIDQRIENNYQHTLQRDKDVLGTRGLAVWNYESRAHLKNDWQ